MIKYWMFDEIYFSCLTKKNFCQRITGRVDGVDVSSLLIAVKKALEQAISITQSATLGAQPFVGDSQQITINANRVFKRLTSASTSFTQSIATSTSTYYYLMKLIKVMNDVQSLLTSVINDLTGPGGSKAFLSQINDLVSQIIAAALKASPGA